MNSLEEYIKDRDIKTILGHHASEAMGFMVDNVTEHELIEDRRICAEEIEKRISQTTNLS